MSTPQILFLLAIALIIIASIASYIVARSLRKRGINRWMFTYVRERCRRGKPHADREVHLLLCIADHFEPGNGGAAPSQSRERVKRWVEEYPRLFSQFRDRDCRPPRHTFFFPLEQYNPDHLESLGKLCRAGFGEVEVHLHHDNETSESLRSRLMEYKSLLMQHHGLLAKDRETGEISYGFIHGNWALDNSRPDGRLCGVNNELDILRETGCYADFTMPSVPDPCQTSTINSIYYAVDDPDKPKSHDAGTRVGTGRPMANALLLIQGPLVLDWKRRKWGLLPRIENGCIQGNQPATVDRVASWLRAAVQVPTHPIGISSNFIHTEPWRRIKRCSSESR